MEPHRPRNVCKFKDTFIKYISGFFEPFRPCLALKLAKYKEKNPYGNHETQILMLSSNPLKKCNKIHPKKVKGRKVLHTE
jgi:hypothetical protein